MAKYQGAYRNELDEEEVETTTPEVEDTPPVSAEDATYKKRYGDLRRHMSTVEAKMKADIDELKGQLAEATKSQIKFPKTEDEVLTWAKKYPDVAAIITTIAKKQAIEATTQVEEKMGRLKELEDEIAQERAVTALLKVHPDFMEIRDEPAFHEWAEGQAQWVQDALYNGYDVRAASNAVTLFKQETGYGKAKRGRPPVDAARPVRQNASPELPDREAPVYKESQVAKMSSREYDQHEAKIEEAIRAGRFEYDLSGAAR